MFSKKLFLTHILIYTITSFNSTVIASVNFKGPELVLELSAGNEPDQVTIVFAPEGGGWHWPNDFAVDYEGNIWILDWLYGSKNLGKRAETKGRVQKFSEKGDYLLQFPDNSSFTEPLICKYLRVDQNGNVVIGPLRADNQLIVINKEGKFLRKIPLYVPIGTIVDFGINSFGEIIYFYKGNLIIMNLEGKIIYTLEENMPFIEVRKVSPYSKFTFYKRGGRNQLIQYSGELKNKIKKELELSKPVQPELQNAIGQEALQCDAEGNMFIMSVIKKIPYNDRKILFYDANGNFVNILPDCPKFSINQERRVVHVLYKTDINGNFYQMEVAPPEDAEIKPFEPIKSSKSCLRIWKWERVKE
jgi:hypothetical protein